MPTYAIREKPDAERFCVAAHCERIAPPTGSCGYCLACYTRITKAARGRRIPVDRVQARLQALKRHGWTVATIERETAIGAETLNHIMSQGQARAGSIQEWHVTAAKVFMLPLVDQPDKPVPMIGAQRRLRALMSIGHAFQDLIEASELRDRQLRDIHNTEEADAQHATVPLYVHQRICGLYDELSMTEGESRSTRGYARIQGWESPLAWNDDPDSAHFIDDPQAKPSGGKVDQTRHQRKHEVDRLRREEGLYVLVDASEAREHVHKLRNMGWTYKDIAEAAELGQETIRCVYARNTRIRRERVQAIMGVPLERRGEPLGMATTAYARKHIDALRELGWSYVAIADASDLPTNKVRYIHVKVKTSIAVELERILAIPLEDPPPRVRRSPAEIEADTVKKAFKGNPPPDTGYAAQRAMAAELRALRAPSRKATAK